MLILYRAAIRIYFLLILVASLFSRKARKLVRGRRRLADTFKGYHPDNQVRTIWIHASSLGEFEQGRPLIEQWKATYPADRFLLSFYSPSGFEVRQDYALADQVFYLPMDTRRRMDRLVRLIRPDLFVLVKYDFWPEMLGALHRYKIPSCLISARFRAGQFLLSPAGSFILKKLKSFRQIFVQDDESLLLLKQRGFSQVLLAGDTRVDAVVANQRGGNDALKKGYVGNDRQILVAGSTWLPEERLLARYWCGEARGKFLADWRLIIAPHEVNAHRLEAIEQLFGEEVIRYSRWEKTEQKDWKILLIDRIGLLRHLYFQSDIALVGGGFGRGIHNVLEPAAAGIPILFGPRYQKFGEAIELLSSGAAFSFESFADLENLLDNLILNPKKRSEAGHLAFNYLQKSAGSTSLIIKTLLRILPNHPAKNGY